MRRLSMRSKRRKFETSSSESAESDNNRDEKKISSRNNNVETTSMVVTRKAPLKRRSRSTASQIKDDRDKSNTKETVERKPSPNKRKRKEDQKASTSSPTKNSNDEEYEVEKIIAHRTIKGRQQFLIRWKGYDESTDSWEDEKDLNCIELIEDFLMNEKKNKVVKTTKIKPRIQKAKKTKGDTKKQTGEEERDHDDVTEKDDSKEFEVERIIEVHFKKNGTRNFLIRWKGFGATDDTWEPEKNLNCPELIAKFMQKLEKLKTANMRELRTNPVRTKRYTLTTPEIGRRLSRRHMDKQRATYHECD